jgi:hypothetical protein
VDAQLHVSLHAGGLVLQVPNDWEVGLETVGEVCFFNFAKSDVLRDHFETPRVPSIFILKT